MLTHPKHFECHLTHTQIFLHLLAWWSEKKIEWTVLCQVNTSTYIYTIVFSSIFWSNFFCALCIQAVSSKQTKILGHKKIHTLEFYALNFVEKENGVCREEKKHENKIHFSIFRICTFLKFSVCDEDMVCWLLYLFSSSPSSSCTVFDSNMPYAHFWDSSHFSDNRFDHIYNTYTYTEGEGER